MWHLAWWPVRHSRVCAEPGEAVGAAGGRQLLKFLLWFKTTNTWPGRQPCPLQNNGCTCRSLLDALSEALVLRFLLPRIQNVVCINEVFLSPFPLVQWNLLLCSTNILKTSTATLLDARQMVLGLCCSCLQQVLFLKFLQP